MSKATRQHRPNGVGRRQSKVERIAHPPLPGVEFHTKDGQGYRVARGGMLRRADIPVSTATYEDAHDSEGTGGDGAA